MEYKHYIRIDSQNRIVKAFSDAFQSPQDGDILYRETDERHFHLNIFDNNEIYKWEWSGKEIVAHKYDDEDKTIVALAQNRAFLAASDQAMIRGIDDLVNVLIDKKIISRDDLPSALTDKLAARERMRG